MKKLIALLITVCLVTAMFAGCSSSKPSSPAPAAPAVPAASGAAAPAPAPAPAPAEKPIKLLFAHNQTSLAHSFHLGTVKFKEEVERISGGLIEIEIHAGDLGTNESELIEKVKLGAADFCIASPSFMAPVGVREVDLMAFTYLFDSMEHWQKSIDGEFGNLVRESVKKNTNNDFQILGNFIAGIREIYAKKFIKSEEDMKGMKIRVQNSPVCTEYWTMIGAVPASIGWGELYQALQQNTVDGAENSYVSFVLMNHHTTENGKFITQTDHDYATRPVYVNGKKFDSLSDQQRAWITEAMQIAEKYQREADAALGEECKQQAISEGAQVYVPTTAEIQFMIDAAVKQQDAFAKAQGLEAELKMIRDAR